MSHPLWLWGGGTDVASTPIGVMVAIWHGGDTAIAGAKVEALVTPANTKVRYRRLSFTPLYLMGFGDPVDATIVCVIAPARRSRMTYCEYPHHRGHGDA